MTEPTKAEIQERDDFAKQLPKPRALKSTMKLAILLVCITFALLLGGCADQSVITDEEYRELKAPAPHSPNYSKTLPGY